MLVSKLLDGVIVVEQRASRRAFRPKFAHRVMLTRTFRNFTSLPILVLASWQKAVITAIVADGVVVSVPSADSGMIIGTVENVPMAGAAIVNKEAGCGWLGVGIFREPPGRKPRVSVSLSGRGHAGLRQI